jgi:hypothetical protein
MPGDGSAYCFPAHPGADIRSTWLPVILSEQGAQGNSPAPCRYPTAWNPANACGTGAGTPDLNGTDAAAQPGAPTDQILAIGRKANGRPLALTR